MAVQQLLRPDQSLRSTFFKCLRWQLEETLDPLSCPYHYFCDSIYAGDYPPAVDILVLSFTAATYSATLFLMLTDMITPRRTPLDPSKRCFIPSGPVSLPVFIFILAKGHRINSIFPLSLVGPAILQLVYISALSFDAGAGADIKSIFLETSTVSGILHASLNVDAVVLPYYTGLDALIASRFSGECPSCVCRNDALVVGGTVVGYRGWSATTLVVVGSVCARVIFRISGEKTAGKVGALRWAMEGWAWMMITLDCVYLAGNFPPEKTALRVSAFGGVLALVLVRVLKSGRQWQLATFCATPKEKLEKV